MMNGRIVTTAFTSFPMLNNEEIEQVRAGDAEEAV